MGGYGSGRRSGKATVGECQRIEFPHLKKLGFFQPNGFSASGRVSWTRRGEPSGDINLTVIQENNEGRMILKYAAEGESILQDIPLVRVPMRFGGVRWWALCPISGKRCGTLVYRPRLRKFVSVKAAGIAYCSQTEQGLDSGRSRALKAEKRYKALSKYTRSTKRIRLQDEWIEKEMEADRMFDEFAGRMAMRINKFDRRVSRRV